MPFRARVRPFAGMTAEFVCVRDAEVLARAVLPPMIWDFVSGGSGAELTRRANRVAFDRVALVPRIMADVSGSEHARRADRLRREPAGRRGADGLPARGPPRRRARPRRPPVPPPEFRTRPPCCHSTRLEEIAALGGCVWFQLYWLRDKGVLADLIARARGGRVPGPDADRRRARARAPASRPAARILAARRDRRGEPRRRRNGEPSDESGFVLGRQPHCRRLRPVAELARSRLAPRADQPAARAQRRARPR